MADIKDSSEVEGELLDQDEEQQNESSLLEENDNQAEDEITEDVNHEVEEAALLDQDGDTEHQNDSSLLDDDAANGAKMDGVEKSEGAADNDEATEERLAAEENIVNDDGKTGELEDEEDDEAEEDAKHKDPNEMPQVNVANLAKRKWQVKVYPLKPEDFSNGQISRVFNNARESLLYIMSSGRSSGGKGEMYVSSALQASRVVQNLMKLDFKSSNINIEIIKKNAEGAIEEKAFMRFDAKLVRMLCVPLLPTRRMGSKRERIIGSVFVKNLPKSASKDMLRVMFPFAPEINYNPDKFQDGTARLVLSTRNAVVPCLKAFSKVELGDTSLELRPLQKKPKSEEGTSRSRSHDKADSENAKKSESKEGESKSESESKPSDTKKDAKESSKSSSEKKDSSAKKSPFKSANVKNDRSKERAQSTKTHSASGDARNRNGRDQIRNRRWRNSRDGRRDGGLRRGGTSMGQRLGGDRNRMRSGSGFGNRNRSDDRRMRVGLPGAGGAGDMVNAEAAKEMIMLQSQLSMAIKSQLSMLNQTQFALEAAKRDAVGVSMSRNVAQAAPTSLLSKHVSDPYAMSQLPSEQTRRGQMKSGNRRQQNRRGRPRDRRAEGGELASLVGDYGYKRSANMANLAALDYGASGGFGKRRNAGLAGHSEGPSWSEDRGASAFGHQQSAFGYDQEMDEREAEYHSLQAGSLGSSGLGYGHGSYGYRY